ncbi:hypothetical protein [Deinococcus puniceus]|jgi:hypothetical protein|uniref:hypothetical protein n=1 Tax=Deinococcus puniceus TaxID=1182568 RepID=UPI000AA02051|nr:hypothetical protein [Deinococcus puniceus]
MTVNNNSQDQAQDYVRAQEVKRESKPPRTEAEIRAEMKESVRRNARVLQTLAKL